jgi:hypothetical protein
METGNKNQQTPPLKTHPRTETLLNEYEKFKKLWFQLWHVVLKKKDAGKLLDKKHWPYEMRDPIVRLRFLQKAIQEAHDYCRYKGSYPEFPAPWIFSGLFRGNRWLWDRTYTGLESFQELYQQDSCEVPERFKDILRRML